MKKYLWLFLTALCSYIFYFFSLPLSTPYTTMSGSQQYCFCIMEMFFNRPVQLYFLFFQPAAKHALHTAAPAGAGTAAACAA